MARDIENYNRYMRNYMKKRRHNDPDFRRKTTSAVHKSQKRIKSKIIALLGERCSNPNCPIPREKLDPRALQIDHVHGHGRKERKRFITTRQYYGYILKQIQDGSKDYQLLCAYCNWIKMFESGT